MNFVREGIMIKETGKGNRKGIEKAELAALKSRSRTLNSCRPPEPFVCARAKIYFGPHLSP
jgi:hypothetical protein